MRPSRAQLFRPALLPREPLLRVRESPAMPEWTLAECTKRSRDLRARPAGPDPAKPGVYAFAEKISLALFTEARTAFRHSLASCSLNAICSRATRATSSKTAFAWAMLLLCSLVSSCTADSNRAVCSATAFSSELAACSTCALNSAMTASWVPAGFSARRLFVQCNITQPDWLSRVYVAAHHGEPFRGVVCSACCGDLGAPAAAPRHHRRAPWWQEVVASALPVLRAGAERPRA